MFANLFSSYPASRFVREFRFVLAFQPDIADPSPTCIEVGQLRVIDDEYRGFVWWIDPESMNLDPVTMEIFRVWPVCLRNLVAQWPAFEGEYDDIGAFIQTTLARSTLFVARVDRQTHRAVA